MSKISQFNSKEDILEQASLWVSRMDRGLTGAEKQALQTWIKESKAHEQALMKMASLWDDLTVLEELKSLFPLAKAKSKRQVLLPLAMAASVALVSLVSMNVFFDATPTQLWTAFNSTEQSQKYRTEIGEQSSFSLPDGSVLQLNTNSVVTISYANDKRLLTLEQGEANFDVAKDKSKPFVVSVGNKSFTALGTVFNIQKTTESDIELTVTEGQVLINQSTDITETLQDISQQLPIADLEGLLVQTGEKAVIENNAPTPVEKISEEQVERDLAWQTGKLIFDGESLSDVLKEVSRYNDANFDVIDSQLNELKISGYFKAGDINGLLESLSYNFDIDYQKKSNGMIVLRQAKANI
ncbi:FecR domain-containing protein [Endozoicomonas sp. G2_1]|uniref:FecR family protein n=1 Tax=Endozoicomonas sp. G2_1 TaxID=2821091 RepID=UPI001ADB5553|nr:FecR domain-containing protein [Endozoicomonas sp. G2_1]MBO9488784.1 FecR domain-containing protein [Endozoicomonas sp. G2_1]